MERLTSVNAGAERFGSAVAEVRPRMEHRGGAPVEWFGGPGQSEPAELTRDSMLFTSVSVLALTFAQAADASQSPARPNMVIVLADDFGVGDIQAHYPDNKIPTPHLDRLVREGRSFTDAHSSSAVCSPTRYGLLTGRYNWRTRLQEWVIAAYEPPLIAEKRPTALSNLRFRVGRRLESSL
jgi:hypothetical protein